MSGAWQEFEAESRDASRRLVVVGIVVAVAVLGAFWYFGDRERQVPPEATEGPVTADVTPATSVPLESVTEVSPPPVGAGSAGLSNPGGRQTVVGVYECVVNGQRVLSDLPCGPEAQVRAVVVDRPDPQDVVQAQQRTQAAQAGSVAGTYRSASTASAGNSAVASSEAANSSACAAVDREIAALNVRMRQGYTSQEGEGLHQHWRELQKRREALDCGR